MCSTGDEGRAGVARAEEEPVLLAEGDEPGFGKEDCRSSPVFTAGARAY
jgi:hypothetical protein